MTNENEKLPWIDFLTNRFARVSEAQQAGDSSFGGLAARTRQVARARWLLLILIDNAIKYTPAGGAVDLRLAKDKERAIIRIADTGPEGHGRGGARSRHGTPRRLGWSMRASHA